jgi:hypothetical protein
MSRSAPPLRFLGLVLGSWICGRLLIVAPGWLTETAEAGQSRARAPAQAVAKSVSAPVPARIGGFQAAKGTPALQLAWLEQRVPRLPRQQFARLAVTPPASSVAVSTAIPDASNLPFTGPPMGKPLPLVEFSIARPALPVAPTFGRWTLSTWAFVRRGGPTQLATGGTLGGSQVGARATYALNDGLSGSARLYAPLNNPSAAEAALGLDVQPLRHVPVRVLAERRQAIGSGGRSAFALIAHGGINEAKLIGGVRIDAYAQAGVVGLNSRDGFVDGAVRLALPLGERFSLGMGAWGAAQPGVSRVDLGPHASYRLPLPGGNARLSAEWRMRVAGDARPGSGPALTLSTDF